ncbi:MAG: metallophosphoesterase [Stigonema ocellatum SAG 48.90 = DSM 106950]|nr:metallophosphoesterase [Stigonema ocellatum SAG 48.90 = DSM 106950]
MQIQLVSDLHVDFQEDWGRSLLNTIKAPEVDILIIAGDLAKANHPAWEQSLVELSAHYPHILLVLGNHEYKDSSPSFIEEITTKLEKALPNLHVLENQTITLEGVKFAGTTLWFNSTVNSYKDESLINDPVQVWIQERNQTARKFLANVNADVIITHYLPSVKSIAPQYQNHPLNHFFFCDVEDIIYSMQPQYWFHGHTHIPCSYQIGSTQIIANPHGYPEEASDHNFVEQFILEVSVRKS